MLPKPQNRYLRCLGGHLSRMSLCSSFSTATFTESPCGTNSSACVLTLHISGCFRLAITWRVPFVPDEQPSPCSVPAFKGRVLPYSPCVRISPLCPMASKKNNQDLEKKKHSNNVHVTLSRHTRASWKRATTIAERPTDAQMSSSLIGCQGWTLNKLTTPARSRRSWLCTFTTFTVSQAENK